MNPSTVQSAAERLRVLWAGLLPVLAALLLLDPLLSWTLGSRPRWIGREPVVPAEVLDRLASRVRAVRDSWPLPAAGAGWARDNVRLTVVVGLSTAREGLQPALLERAAGTGHRVLNLAASGGSFSELAAYCAPLLSSGLLPDRVIVGVHASWLAGRGQRSVAPPERPLLPHRPGEDGAQPLTSRWREWLRDHSWLLANRPGIVGDVLQGTYRLRSLTGATASIPMQDPWAVEMTYHDDRASPEFLQQQQREWSAAGWFDAARMDRPSKQAQSFYSLLLALRQRAPQVQVLLLPEAEAFRSQVPPEAVSMISSIAREADPSIEVIDLRALLPESAFRDLAHVNAEGRAQLASQVGAWLRSGAAPGRQGAAPSGPR